jgi:nitrogen-specific signal transduction histidine kinase/ActR/RegA family two-component response regulator
MTLFLYLIPLTVAILNFFLFAYVFGLRQKSNVSRAFLGFCAHLTILPLCDFLLKIFPHTNITHHLLNASAIFLFTCGLLFLHLSYLIAQKKKGFIYYICVTFVILASISVWFFPFAEIKYPDTIKVPLVFLTEKGFLLFILSVFLPIIPGLFIFYKTLKSTKNLNQRKPLQLLFLGIIINVLVTVLIFVFFMILQKIVLAGYFTSLSLLPLPIFIFLAVNKYHFLTVNTKHIQQVSHRIFENVEEAIMIADKNGDIIQLNKTAMNLLQLEDDKNISYKILENKIHNYTFTTRYAHHQTHFKDNEKKIIAISQYPIGESDREKVGTIIIISDVSEKNALEQELHRTRQFENLGILAGGIAHDFNNFLSGISGIISLIKADLPEDAKNPGDLLNIGLQSVERASTITNQLLTLAKGGTPHKHKCFLHSLIRDTVSFVLSGKKVTAQIHCTESNLEIEADSGQLGQVFQNLTLNAVQAMPDGGEITIDISKEFLESDNQKLLKCGDYAVIKFRDQGIGMTTEVLDKIFNPYFTTKTEGSGLGLTITYSIIKRHGGTVSVLSEPGKGTEFVIYLPFGTTSTLCQSTQFGLLNKPDSIYSGTILIMDDDDLIRLLLTRMLHKFGYKVDATSDGEQALEKFEASRKTKKPYRFIISDLTVQKGMGGEILCKKIRKLDSDIPIIISSGYSDQSAIDLYKEFGISTVLKKPYSWDELKENIDKIENILFSKQHAAT